MSEKDRSFELVITRQFDAPLELVWKAWTDPEYLSKWWGPKGFGWMAGKMDLKPGGIFQYGLKSPTGQVMWGKFVFREVDPLKRLEYVVSFSDENGGITRHPLSETWPLEVLNVIEFKPEGNKTTLVLRGKAINASEEEYKTFESAQKAVEQGFAGTMAQLDEFLSKIKG